MRLFIIRHGQTTWNVLKRFQGQVNIPLNDFGREQTFLLKEKIQDLPYDLIYTSPLNRCTEMAEIINDQDKEIIVEPLIIEMGFGIYEGESFADKSLFKEDHPFYNYFNDKLNYVPPEGAESFQDVLDRANAFLEKISREHKNQSILAFSHGAFIRSLINVIEQNPDDVTRHISAPKNCSVTVISDNSGKFMVEQSAVDVIGGEELLLE